MDQCQWVPFGPPGTTAGMCVYDWDRCKAPIASVEASKKRLAAKAAKAAHVHATQKKHSAIAKDVAPVAPTPKPKLTCNMTDSTT